MAEVLKNSMHGKYDRSSELYKSDGVSTIKSSKIFVPDVEFAFGWSRFNLRLIGLWPDPGCKDNQTSLIMRFSPPIWSVWVFSFVVVPQALAPIVHTFTLGELIELISAVAGITAAIVRIMVLWHNSGILAWCLSFLTEDWERKLSKCERKTMIKNARFGRNISIGLTILMQCLVWSYVFLKAWPLLYLNLDAYNSTDLSKQLFYPSYCPLDLNKTSNFVFVWIGQYISIICSAFTYSGVDGFVAILIIHLCGQVTILRHELIHIVDDHEDLNYEMLRIKIAVIVKRHHKLIGLSSAIKDSIHFMLLVVIFVYTFQFGLQLFRLLIAVTEREPGKLPFLEVFVYIFFLNVMFVHLFIYCYVGDMLIQESEALGLATYSSKWYNLRGNEARDFKIVMCRASAPLQIWAGKFVPFSLELFGNVLKTSMGYFSLLLTMKEQSTE